MKLRISKAQLVLKSYKRFGRTKKSGGQALKKATNEKYSAKRLEPQKKRVSKLLDDFPKLLVEDEES